MKRIVYFATGQPEDTAAELTRIRSSERGAFLKVVVPVASIQQLQQLIPLEAREVLGCSSLGAPFLWLRLWIFLGSSLSSEIICLKAPGRHRMMKVLAALLPGKLILADSKGRLQPCRRWHLLRAVFCKFIEAEGPICLIGTASSGNLRKILASLRLRYPLAKIHGLLADSSDTTLVSLFESCRVVNHGGFEAYVYLLPRCFGKRRFKRIIVPFTRENASIPKWIAWLLPYWHIEIYNENLDVFSGRNLYSLARHCFWRLREVRDWWLRRRKRREIARRPLPVGVMGSTSVGQLKKIVAAVRTRYPEAPLVGLLPYPVDPKMLELFDSTRILEPDWRSIVRQYRAIARNPFQCWIVPSTDGSHSGLKFLAWLLPIWRIEFYNENLDVIFARNLYSLIRHHLWRIRDEREIRRRLLPIGVVGSASGFYLKKIIPSLRARYPDARIHGLFSDSLDPGTMSLFDSVTILNSGIGRVWECWKASRGLFQFWVIPCTDEPYFWMKLLLLVPGLGPRHIYNELADGFPLRDSSMLYNHMVWRYREHLSFQIIAGTAGRNLVLRVLHLGLFALRLLSGAALLAEIRIRSHLRLPSDRSRDGRWRSSTPATSASTVDVIYISSGAEDAPFVPPLCRHNETRAHLARVSRHLRLSDFLGKLNSAIQSSNADFICLLDSRCRMMDEDWLERLLEAFDDCTAQVGPQVVNPEGGVIRGGLIAPSAAAQWNSDHTVCWHVRPEWLSPEALPIVCLVVRRSVFAKVGFFRGLSEHNALWVDLEFCRRLATAGLRSICNQTVTCLFPIEIAQSEQKALAGVAQTFDGLGGGS